MYFFVQIDGNKTNQSIPILNGSSGNEENYRNCVESVTLILYPDVLLLR